MALSIKRLVTIAGFGFLILLTTFVVSQTIQIVSIAGAIHPLLGRIVLCVLVCAYALLVLAAVFEILRLPAPLVPALEGTPEHQKFLRALGLRLRKNRHLAGIPVTNRTEIETAIRHLNNKADDHIKKAARAMFVSTAISQNGRLDGLMVPHSPS